MHSMNAVTHFVAVGCDGAVIEKSIKEFPIQRIILLISEGTSEKETLCIQQTAQMIERDFKTDTHVIRHSISSIDVLNVALGLVSLIDKEYQQGNEPRINIASSPQYLAIACYIAALISRTPVYTIVHGPRIRTLHGERKSGDRIVDMPLLPLHKLREDQVTILDKLLRGKADSIDELLYRVDPDLKGNFTHEYYKERSRIHWHLKKLREAGDLFSTTKDGKKTQIELTDYGRALVIAHQFSTTAKRKEKKRVSPPYRNPANKRMKEGPKTEHPKHRD